MRSRFSGTVSPAGETPTTRAAAAGGDAAGQRDGGHQRVRLVAPEASEIDADVVAASRLEGEGRA